MNGLARPTRALLLCLRRTPAEETLLQWGCSPADLLLITSRRPSVSRMDPSLLLRKLDSLLSAGLSPPHLARVLACRPRFLSRRLGPALAPRLAFLRSLLPSPSLLLRAVLRNPSLLSSDVPPATVSLYDSLGVPPLALGRLLLSRPTVISRSSFSPEKLELIHSLHLPREAATYKYAVSVIAVSNLDTINAKIANLEKFGFSRDVILRLFGRSPNILTLSVDKVQRNMTYLVGTMRLPATVAVEQPFLLFANLERVLRPRFVVGGRIEEMGLEPVVKGEKIVTALRMTEQRFLKKFVDCHEKKVKEELRELYFSVKGVERLAANSKSSTARRGFPF